MPLSKIKIADNYMRIQFKATILFFSISIIFYLLFQHIYMNNLNHFEETLIISGENIRPDEIKSSFTQKLQQKLKYGFTKDNIYFGYEFKDNPKDKQFIIRSWSHGRYLTRRLLRQVKESMISKEKAADSIVKTSYQTLESITPMQKEDFNTKLALILVAISVGAIVTQTLLIVLKLVDSTGNSI